MSLLMKIEHVHNSRIAGFDLNFTIMALPLVISMFSKWFLPQSHSRAAATAIATLSKMKCIRNLIHFAKVYWCHSIQSHARTHTAFDRATPSNWMLWNAFNNFDITPWNPVRWLSFAALTVFITKIKAIEVLFALGFWQISMFFHSCHYPSDLLYAQGEKLGTQVLLHQQRLPLFEYNDEREC